MTDKHKKKCSTKEMQTIREMPTETTVRYYFTPTRMTPKKKKTEKLTGISKMVEKLEHLFPAGGNVKWYSHHVKLFGSSSKVKQIYHMTQQFYS